MGSTGKAKAGGGSKTLERLAERQYNLLEPGLKLYAGQTEEALRTGGIGAQIPVIKRAEEGSRAATSQALTQLDQQLALSPALASSPWAALARGRVLQAGELSTSQIPVQIAQGFIGAAPGFLNQGAQISFGGLGSAGGQQTAANIATSQNQIDFLKAMFQTGASLGKLFAPGAA